MQKLRDEATLGARISVHHVIDDLEDLGTVLIRKN